MVDPLLPSRTPRAQEEQTTKILVIDEHPIVREALARLLVELSRRVVVRQAGSVKSALAELAAHPDTSLILLDMLLLDAQAPHGLEQFQQMQPRIPLVLFSDRDDRATVFAALERGAMGLVSKRSTSAVLVNALRIVLAGGIYMPPECRRTEAAERTTPEATATQASQPAHAEVALTRRQLDVLWLLIQGKPTKVISQELGVSPATVKIHTASIFRTLGVSNRTEAACAANQLGIAARPTAALFRHESRVRSISA